MRLSLILSAAALTVLGAMCAPAQAQTATAIAVTACGTAPTVFTAGRPVPLTEDLTGTLCTAGGGGGGGSATAANQTNGLALTQIVDSLGNVIGSQSNALNVYGINFQTMAFPIGSTTSGLVGGLIQGAVTASAPDYSALAGKISPFSLDEGGALRVNVVTGGGTGGTSSTFTSTFPGTGTAFGAYYAGNMTYIGADSAHNLGVNVGAVAAATQPASKNLVSSTLTKITGAGTYT